MLYLSSFRWLAPVIAAAVALISASSILFGQFHGEDEIAVLTIGSRALEQPAILGAGVHAPGRYLTATLSTGLLGPSLLNLRLPHLLFWTATVAAAASIAQRLTSPAGGLVAGLLLALSGLWHTEAFAGAHAMATFWILLLIWYKLRHPTWSLQTKQDRRRYFIGGLLAFLSFLWFTDGIVINAMYHLLYLSYNRRNLKRYALSAALFLILFVLYYALFVGVPYVMWKSGVVDHPIGQLHQYLLRANAAHLNLSAIKENFLVLNWYQFPLLGWILFILGTAWQMRHRRDLFLLLAPHWLIFNFYIVGGTPQHFFSDYIWVLPFGITQLFSFTNPQPFVTGRTIIMLGLLISVVAGFSYNAHAKLYTETTYPEALVTHVWGATLGRRNVYRPLSNVVIDLVRVLDPADRFTVTTERSIPNYYFRDDRYVKIPITKRQTESGACFILNKTLPNLRAVIIDRREPLCPGQAIERVMLYHESYLAVIVLKPS
jgi:hypothetical protein